MAFAFSSTALAAVVLPIGSNERQVQCLRRQGKSDLLTFSPATEAWLRDGYRQRMSTPTVSATSGRCSPTRTDTVATAPESSSRSTSAASTLRAARGMTAARARLAALAAVASYALALIADAALPLHRPGERLDDLAVAHVASAVEILAQCRYSAAALGDIVAHYRDRYGERCWREQSWQRQLRTAALRYRHPRFYGLSPCGADPSRLACADAPSSSGLIAVDAA